MVEVGVEMAYGKDIVLRARKRGGLECVHADVDIAAVLFVLVAHPVLKGSVGYFGSGANALCRLTTLRIPHQDGDAVGRFKVRANVFGRRYGLSLELIFKVGHGLDSSF